jgi:hypothetical protein
MIAVDRFFEVAQYAQPDDRLVLNGKDVEIAKETIGDKVLGLLSNVPGAGSIKSIREYSERIRLENAKVMAAFIDAVRRELPGRESMIPGIACSFEGGRFEDTQRRSVAHSGVVALDQRVLRRVDLDRSRFLRLFGAEKSSPIKSLATGDIVDSQPETDIPNGDAVIAKEPSRIVSPYGNLTHAGDYPAFNAWAYKERKKGALQDELGKVPTSSDFLDLAIKESAPTELIIALVRYSNDLAPEQKKGWLARAYRVRASQNVGEYPSFRAWAYKEREMGTLQAELGRVPVHNDFLELAIRKGESPEFIIALASHSREPTLAQQQAWRTRANRQNTSGRFNALADVQRVDEFDSLDSWSKDLRKLSAAMESVTQSSSGSQANYRRLMAEKGFAGEAHEKLLDKLGPHVVTYCSTTLRLYSNLPPEQGEKIAYGRDAVVQGGVSAFSGAENGQLVGCIGSSYAAPGAHRLPGNQVSVAMETPVLLAAQGKIVFPIVLSVMAPALDSGVNPDWETYTFVGKDNVTELNDLRYDQAIATLCKHVRQCVKEHPDKQRIVISGFGQGAALDALSGAGRAEAHKIFAENVGKLVAELRKMGKQVSFTDISDDVLASVQGVAGGPDLIRHECSVPADWITSDDLIVNGASVSGCISDRSGVDSGLNGFVGKNSLAHDIHAHACRIYHACFACDNLCGQQGGASELQLDAARPVDDVSSHQLPHEIASNLEESHPADVPVGPPSLTIPPSENRISNKDIINPDQGILRVLDAAYKAWQPASAIKNLSDFLSFSTSLKPFSEILGLLSTPLQSIPALVESVGAVLLLRKEIQENGKSLPQRAIYAARDGIVQAGQNLLKMVQWLSKITGKIPLATVVTRIFGTVFSIAKGAGHFIQGVVEYYYARRDAIKSKGLMQESKDILNDEERLPALRLLRKQSHKEISKNDAGTEDARQVKLGRRIERFTSLSGKNKKILNNVVKDILGVNILKQEQNLSIAERSKFRAGVRMVYGVVLFTLGVLSLFTKGIAGPIVSLLSDWAGTKWLTYAVHKTKTQLDEENSAHALDKSLADAADQTVLDIPLEALEAASHKLGKNKFLAAILLTRYLAIPHEEKTEPMQAGRRAVAVRCMLLLGKTRQEIQTMKVDLLEERNRKGVALSIAKML